MFSLIKSNIFSIMFFFAYVYMFIEVFDFFVMKMDAADK